VKAQRWYTRLLDRIERDSAPLWNRLIPATTIDQVPGADLRTLPFAVPGLPALDLAGADLHPVAAQYLGAEHAPRAPTVALLRGVWFEAGHHVILDGAGRMVMDSVSTGDDRSFLGFRRVVLPLRERLEGCWTTHRSRHNSYYHQIVDNLPRLFALEFARTLFGVTPKLLVSSPLTASEDYFFRRLAPSDIEVVQVDPRRRYWLEEFLLLGFLTRPFAGWLPPEYLSWLRAKALPQRPSRHNRRILIVRRAARDKQFRCLLNEDEVLAALRPLGFEPHVLEELDTATQVELFYDAEIVVGAHGAGLANIVFGLGARVLELFPSRWTVPHYYYLARACGHEYAAVHGDGKHRNANFRISVPLVLNGVARWL
jgi:hypothetical protein